MKDFLSSDPKFEVLPVEPKSGVRLGWGGCARRRWARGLSHLYL